MKRYLFVLGLFFIASGNLLNAQEFSIVNVDAALYPAVKVTVNVTDENEAAQTSFKVYENGKEVPFTFEKEKMQQENAGRAVCFLLEASGYTYGSALSAFKNAVSDALKNLGENDVVNICYFGKADKDGKTLNVVSAEFTSDHNILISEMKSKIIAQKDTNYTSDVFKGIYECLDFMNGKQNLPESKMLIVLSAAINNSRSPIRADDCIENANKFSIPVYTITYKTNNRYAADNFVRISDKTNAKSISAKSSEEISSALESFLGEASGDAVTTGMQYLITFTSTQNDEVNTFEVEYEGNKQQATFEMPEGSESFFQKYWWLLLIGLVAIIGILITIIIISSKGKKAKAEKARQLRELEQKNIQLQEQLKNPNVSKTMVPPAKEPAKYDLKKTVIGGGGGIPVLKVQTANFDRDFQLTKMQMSIGRNTGNDIVIPDQTVSGNHASIINESGFWYIVDHSSTNGTFVNGTKVSKQKINHNDLIKLGAASVKVQF